MKDLGWANGWKETPEIVSDCREAEHKPVWQSGAWSCTHVVTCEKCGYKYSVDSSG